MGSLDVAVSHYGLWITPRDSRHFEQPGHVRARAKESYSGKLGQNGQSMVLSGMSFRGFALAQDLSASAGLWGGRAADSSFWALGTDLVFPS